VARWRASGLRAREFSRKLGVSKLVAIDGKTMRSSFARTLGKSAVHMVSAWAAENALVLGQPGATRRSPVRHDAKRQRQRVRQRREGSGERKSAAPESSGLKSAEPFLGWTRPPRLYPSLPRIRETRVRREKERCDP